ncbi:cell wall-associated NlpC family hydrolase [Rudaeicoccus suwonensis]|uniref:Cell wall-associated NlpC family hydrolase n=1 Tax=Rudaeicoccus suwonensis TaxID=657409 RepID=A0A561E7V5_9MICO|nr:cell wall-associated NlpC family hydrolase [Rudaeicoccus suwonensis]
MTGGLVASIAAPQAAQAADGVATITAAPAAHSVPQATQARQLLAEIVKADPQLSANVKAKSLVVQTAQVRPRTSSVSTVSLTSGSGYQSPVQTNPKQTLPAATGIVAIAERYLGTPYVYGGESPSGFDCSGLTQYVYAQAGISIPRTATAQMDAATLVSTPQPGDLVFFGSGSYAYHVGIYIGNGMMIAAPRPGTVVQIQSIYTTPVAYGRF